MRGWRGGIRGDREGNKAGGLRMYFTVIHSITVGSSNPPHSDNCFFQEVFTHI